MLTRRLLSVIAIVGLLLLGETPGHAQEITGTGTSGFVPKFTGSTTIGNSVIRTSGQNIAVGAAPLADYRFFTVSSSGFAGGAIKGENVAGGKGVFGLSVSGMGVSGESNSNYGVYGRSTSGTGVGVGAENNNTGGIALFALGGSFGIQGHSSAGIGIAGYSTNGTGLRGEGGVTGVVGISSNGNALNGWSSTGNAAYLQGTVQIVANGTNPGNLSVSGTLSKGGGSFKIDHPLDPENKYLYHSFVESPDMMNIYNGNITTNESGDAEVTMPEYFEALNADFRYQLTVIGTFAQAIVAEKMKGNRFLIKTNAPSVEVSWQVTGVRQDAFAKKNRIKVEVEKDERERGFYLHPDAFEQPEEKNTERAHHHPEKRTQLKNTP